MNKTLHTSVVIALSACALSACTINIGAPSSFESDMMHSESSSESEVEMFAEMMIPHHQQAIDMSNLALAASSSVAVKDLAQRIITGQTSEIDLMQGWLDGTDGELTWGMMPRSGITGMGGMASEEEIDHLRALTGSAFDTEFLTLMITHHDGALEMVRMIDDSSVDEVAQLAEDIVRVQSAEIAEMKAMLQDDSRA